MVDYLQSRNGLAAYMVRKATHAITAKEQREKGGTGARLNPPKRTSSDQLFLTKPHIAAPLSRVSYELIYGLIY